MLANGFCSATGVMQLASKLLQQDAHWHIDGTRKMPGNSLPHSLSRRHVGSFCLHLVEAPHWNHFPYSSALFVSSGREGNHVERVEQ
ncbi:hypothetical protein ACYCAX_16065 [Pseudomonas sp. MT3]